MYKPYPSVYVDKWNDDYVRLPCSPQNIDSKNSSKWQTIEKCLKKLSENLVKLAEPSLIEV